MLYLNGDNGLLFKRSKIIFLQKLQQVSFSRIILFCLIERQKINQHCVFKIPCTAMQKLAIFLPSELQIVLVTGNKWLLAAKYNYLKLQYILNYTYFTKVSQVGDCIADRSICCSGLYTQIFFSDINLLAVPFCFNNNSLTDSKHIYHV